MEKQIVVQERKRDTGTREQQVPFSRVNNIIIQSNRVGEHNTLGYSVAIDSSSGPPGALPLSHRLKRIDNAPADDGIVFATHLKRDAVADQPSKVSVLSGNCKPD